MLVSVTGCMSRRYAACLSRFLTLPLYSARYRNSLIGQILGGKCSEIQKKRKNSEKLNIFFALWVSFCSLCSLYTQVVYFPEKRQFLPSLLASDPFFLVKFLRSLPAHSATVKLLFFKIFHSNTSSKPQNHSLRLERPNFPVFVFTRTAELYSARLVRTANACRG